MISSLLIRLGKFFDFSELLVFLNIVFLYKAVD